MRKTLISIALVIGLGCVFAGCAGSGEDSSPESYTITFKQAGQEDIVKEVEEGKDLTDIPAPKSKTGYTVTWDTTDFVGITGDMVVTAVATANTYTITYDAGEGTVTPATQAVVYDSTPTFATPTLEGYTFTGWTYNGNAVLGTWTIAQNVTLVASWTKDVVDTYTVVFRQKDQADKVFENVEKGSTFTNIPEVVKKAGYKVEWDSEGLAKLTNISGTVIVEAIETIRTYTVTLNADGGSVKTKTFTITYGEEYTLETPTNEDRKFKGWTYNGQAISLSGVWNLDVESDKIELVATWGSRVWTPFF